MCLLKFFLEDFVFERVKVYLNMETLLNKQFECVLKDYRMVDEIKDYINDILFQIELNEKDREM